MKDKETKTSPVARIISMMILLGVGVWIYFAFVEPSMQIANETLGTSIPAYALPIVGIISAVIVLITQKRLLSLAPIRTATTFFKKTQRLWFCLLILGVILLSVLNR